MPISKRVSSAGLLVLGIAAIVAMCCNGCQQEPQQQTDVWRPPEEQIEWEVDTIIGAADSSCPCCPIAAASDNALSMKEFDGLIKGGVAGCCICYGLLKSKDGRRWKTHWEKKTPTGYEFSEFQYTASAARPNPDCPCCPIALLALYGVQRGPDTCCVCDFYAVSGTQTWRESAPVSITSDPREVLGTDVICPVAGQLHITGTCDVVRRAGAANPVDVQLQISAGGAMMAGGQPGDAGKTWTIAAGSDATGYTTTVTLRRDFDVTPGKVPVSLSGNMASGGTATGLGLRSLDITFVPAADAGPVGGGQ